MAGENLQLWALSVRLCWNDIFDDLNHRQFYNFEDHNLCGAFVLKNRNYLGSALCFSNPSALSKRLLAKYKFVEGDVDYKIINRGGMRDFDTEVRLLNYLWYGFRDDQITIYLLSMRSVCPHCLRAIEHYRNTVGKFHKINTFEFRTERKQGYPTDILYSVPEGKEMLVTNLELLD